MVREATLTDSDVVSGLMERLYYMQYVARPDIYRAPNKQLLKSIFEKILSDRCAKIFLYEIGGDVIGFCRCQVDCNVALNDTPGYVVSYDIRYINEKWLTIEEIFVVEAFRKIGVGRKLFERAKVYAKECGATKLELSVWHFNEGARQFYERMGMTVRTRDMELTIE